ncbi:MAG TPA: hypothetical protein PKC22_07460 [Rhodocyclaceae bacterium]|nr:hypothetical protein [Rhodocyclaceae bacterium]
MSYRHLHPDRRLHAAAMTIDPPATRWHPAARAAGWTLLVMTLMSLAVFSPG